MLGDRLLIAIILSAWRYLFQANASDALSIDDAVLLILRACHSPERSRLLMPRSFMRLLLVEDEREMAAALSAALHRFDIIVDSVGTLDLARLNSIYFRKSSVITTARSASAIPPPAAPASASRFPFADRTAIKRKGLSLLQQAFPSLSISRAQRGRTVAPISASSIARAACRPSRIAQTTSD